MQTHFPMLYKTANLFCIVVCIHVYQIGSKEAPLHTIYIHLEIDESRIKVALMRVSELRWQNGTPLIETSWAVSAHDHPAARAGSNSGTTQVVCMYKPRLFYLFSNFRPYKGSSLMQRDIRHLPSPHWTDPGELTPPPKIASHNSRASAM